MGSWVVEMQAKLNDLGNGRSQEEQSGWKETSIYKVPSHISKNKETSFQPQLVSFGPYHHWAPHLRSMEAHKEGALLCLLRRSRRCVQEVFDLVAKVAQQLKDSYDSLNFPWQRDNEDFVRLMVLDGCFLLELLQRKCYFKDFGQSKLSSVWHLIKADVLMLENQLPMSLLLKLKVFLEHKESDIKGLNKCILQRLTRNYNPEMDLGQCLHVLDLYRKCLLHKDNNHENKYATASPISNSSRRLTRNNYLDYEHENENANHISNLNSSSSTTSIPSTPQYLNKDGIEGDNISLSVSQSQDQTEKIEVSSISQYVVEDGIEGDNISLSVFQSQDQGERRTERSSISQYVIKDGIKGDNISLSVSQSQDQGERRTEGSLISQYVIEDDIKDDNISLFISQSEDQGERWTKRLLPLPSPSSSSIPSWNIADGYYTSGAPSRGAPSSDSSAPKTASGKIVGHNVVRPATELHEAGVRFKKSKRKGLRDITFEGGVLELPKFTIDDSTESIFLNLIAFEHCHHRHRSDISSFVCFMDRIIDDGPDIKLLSSKGIINNNFGTDKEAADLINKMTKGLVFRMNDDLLEVYKNLINYSNKRWHKWLANLIHTYFRSPWKIISVIAAFILISLTVVQTIFTILN